MKPLMLMILDGFAYREEIRGNAIRGAKKPNLDKLFATYAHTHLGASGMDVGLPEGQMGNSEVGHTNIGAGRIVYQELTRITKAVKEGTFFENEALVAAMENCKANNSALHLCGLLSDGGVHSHNTHLYALLDMAKKQGIEKVFIHPILDGRDVAPDSGVGFVKELFLTTKEKGIGTIATISGRYYAMDRDNRWERVEKAYNAIVNGEGINASCGKEAVEASYAQGVTDEFVVPVVLNDYKGVNENDSFVFFNFRPDRAREITRTLVDKDFSGFERKKGFFPVHYVCMTQYDATMPNVNIAFKPQSLENTFGEYISKKDLNQLRIAETEKYAHVTFFFNGGREDAYENEDRALIPSPKVATYDLKPEMSAYEVANEVVDRIESDKYDVIVLNFANCDMVGHTGIYDAAVKAVEAVDECVGKVVDAVQKKGGTVLLTADHGNADCMVDDEGNVFTAHTVNPVPLLLIGEGKLKDGGVLADIAPTMLDMLGLPKPEEMSGSSLLAK